MSIFYGKNLFVEIYGESHSNKIGVKVKGFPKFKFNNDMLLQFLDRRKAKNTAYSTKRFESDLPFFYGFDGKEITNGELNGDFECVLFNANAKSKDYSNLYARPRPSHADYTAFLKDGTLSYAGGGRFSGRLTAPLCVLGGIAVQYLNSMGIFVAGFVSSIGGVNGVSVKDFCKMDAKPLSCEKIERLRNGFPSLSNKEQMLDLITKTAERGDSVGGTVDCVVQNYKKGVGDNLFGGLESKISSLIYSIPAVKGVEFGLGFDIANEFGSQANDQLYFDENGKVQFYSNNSGGINGGISNGNDILVRTAFRPTPSISIPQKTVDLNACKNVEIVISGRHDSCIVPRAVPCVESAVAIALLDEIL